MSEDVTSNLISLTRDPDVEKYRSINLGSPTFLSKLLPFSGAVGCLFEMGFEEVNRFLAS